MGFRVLVNFVEKHVAALKYFKMLALCGQILNNPELFLCNHTKVI